jgi:hypothetical protein
MLQNREELNSDRICHDTSMTLLSVSDISIESRLEWQCGEECGKDVLYSQKDIRNQFISYFHRR